eukprot:NODE_245_length_11874_cov_0.539546.p1 type:complete len:1365 gc:universal NODE_245_length_11874_cov_0.539546:8930-4836(-)
MDSADRSQKLAAGRSKFKKLQEKRKSIQKDDKIFTTDDDDDLLAKVVHLLSSVSFEHSQELQNLIAAKDDRINELENLLNHQKSSLENFNTLEKQTTLLGDQQKELEDLVSLIESTKSKKQVIKEELELLESDITKEEQERDVLQTKFDELVNSNMSQESEIKDQNFKLINSKKLIEESQAHNVKIEAELSTIRASKVDLEQQKEDLSKSLNILKKENLELEENLLEAKNENSMIKHSVKIEEERGLSDEKEISPDLFNNPATNDDSFFGILTTDPIAEEVTLRNEIKTKKEDIILLQQEMESIQSNYEQKVKELSDFQESKQRDLISKKDSIILSLKEIQIEIQQENAKKHSSEAKLKQIKSENEELEKTMLSTRLLDDNESHLNDSISTAKDFSDQLKLQLDSLNEQINLAEEEKSDLDTQLGTIMKNIEETETQLDIAKNRLVYLEEELHSKVTKLEAVTSEVNSAETTIKDLEIKLNQKVEFTNTIQENANQNLSELMLKQESVDKEISKLQSKLAEKNKKLVALNAQITQEQYDESSAKYFDLDAEHKSLVQNITNKQKEILEAKQEGLIKLKTIKQEYDMVIDQIHKYKLDSHLLKVYNVLKFVANPTFKNIPKLEKYIPKEIKSLKIPDISKIPELNIEYSGPKIQQSSSSMIIGEMIDKLRSIDYTIPVIDISQIEKDVQERLQIEKTLKTNTDLMQFLNNKNKDIVSQIELVKRGIVENESTLESAQINLVRLDDEVFNLTEDIQNQKSVIQSLQAESEELQLQQENLTNEIEGMINENETLAQEQLRTEKMQENLNATLREMQLQLESDFKSISNEIEELKIEYPNLIDISLENGYKSEHGLVLDLQKVLQTLNEVKSQKIQLEQETIHISEKNEELAANLSNTKETVSATEFELEQELIKWQELISQYSNQKIYQVSDMKNVAQMILSELGSLRIDLAKKYEELQQDNDDYQEMIDKLQENLKLCGAQVSLMESKADKLETEISTEQTRMVALQSDYDDILLKKKKIRAELNQINMEYQELMQDLQREKQKRDDLLHIIANIENDVVNLEQDREELEEEPTMTEAPSLDNLKEFTSDSISIIRNIISTVVKEDEIYMNNLDSILLQEDPNILQRLDEIKGCLVNKNQQLSEFMEKLEQVKTPISSKESLDPQSPEQAQKTYDLDKHVKSLENVISQQMLEISQHKVHIQTLQSRLDDFFDAEQTITILEKEKREISEVLIEFKNHQDAIINENSLIKLEKLKLEQELRHYHQLKDQNRDYERQIAILLKKVNMNDLSKSTKYKSQYLKELYFRKDLQYQKQYLQREYQILLKKWGLVQHHLPLSPYPIRLNKFRMAAWMLIAIHRMKMKRIET